MGKAEGKQRQQRKSFQRKGRAENYTGLTAGWGLVQSTNFKWDLMLILAYLRNLLRTKLLTFCLQGDVFFIYEKYTTGIQEK